MDVKLEPEEVVSTVMAAVVHRRQKSEDSLSWADGRVTATLDCCERKQMGVMQRCVVALYCWAYFFNVKKRPLHQGEQQKDAFKRSEEKKFRSKAGT